MPRNVPDSVWVLSLIVLSVSAPVARAGAKAKPIVPDQLPAVIEVGPRETLTQLDGTKVYRGGYGSALAIDQENGVFYLMTDRGPNLDRPKDDEKLFAVPSFTPEIGMFRLSGGRLVRVARIPLRDEARRRLTGLPRQGQGATGETPVGPGGKPLERNPRGLDPEGLVALEDGSFWISDEYGPVLLHVDRGGRTLQRIDPFSATPKLPAVLARRRPNRGMEGLAYVKRENTLVGIMQSPLDNPKKAGRKSTSVRIVSVHLPTGSVRQYLYPLDSPDFFVSEIAALSPQRFLVIEQDGKVPRAPEHASVQRRIYSVDISQATDVSDATDDPAGRQVDGRTIEELSAEDLDKSGIVPSAKQLVVDLLDPALGYWHDKAEGLAVFGDGTIAVSNDDDFGIDADDHGACVAKRNPTTGEVERTQVFIIRPPKLSELRKAE